MKPAFLPIHLHTLHFTQTKFLLHEKSRQDCVMAESQLPVLESWFNHSPSVGCWKSSLISLCLTLLSYKVKIIINSSSKCFFRGFYNTYQAFKKVLAAAAESLQLCPTLCDPIDSSSPSSPVPGILQARALEWVAISFSNAWQWKVKVKPFSRVRLLVTPWTTAHQAPPSMGSSRQEYWSGVPLPSPMNMAHP